MLNTIRKVCGIQKTKFYVNIENTGNTTSSTIPIGLKTCMDNNVIHKGQKVMVAGFGVGLVVGCYYSEILIFNNGLYKRNIILSSRKGGD